jgi:hypothetical protein
VSTNTKPAAEVVLSRNGGLSADRSDPFAPDKSGAPRKRAVEVEKASVRWKTSRATRRSARSSATASKPEKLICRYCGSDDLAPSFKQRRDARCRACFKQRYGSTAKDKKSKPVLKAKTTK